MGKVYGAVILGSDSNLDADTTSTRTQLERYVQPDRISVGVNSSSMLAFKEWGLPDMFARLAVVGFGSRSAIISFQIGQAFLSFFVVAVH